MIAIALVLSFLLLAEGSPSHGPATEPGTLRVIVRDAKSSAPVPLATVEIYGPRSLRAATGLDGVVPFDGATAGDYEVVVRRDGYEEQVLKHVLVPPDGAELDVALQPSPRRPPRWLRQIGTVKAKSRSQASASNVTQDTPESLLASTPVNAAATLPDVSVQHTPSGETVSVFGHPAVQTTVTVDGVPVSTFGTPSNVQPFSLDLFQSVQIDRRSAFGSPGGNVDFTTRNPALDWIGTLDAVAGSFRNDGQSVTASGTSGRLGVSFTAARRDESQLLNRLTFLDTSGLNYRHDAMVQTTGDALKLRYPFSQDHIAYMSFVSLASSAPLVCVQFTGVVPCGYGPHNFENSALSSFQIKDTMASGRLEGSATFFRNASKIDVDQSGRFVYGIAAPANSSARSDSSGAIVDGQYQVGKGYPISFHATVDAQRTAVAGTAFGRTVPPASNTVMYRDASISGSLLDRRRFSSTLALGFQQQGRQGSRTAGLAVKYRPTSVDSFTFDVRTGFLAAPPVTFRGVADPSTLQVNCAANEATGFGPSSGSSDSSSTTTSINWEHIGSRVSTSVTLRHEVDYNGLVTAFVRGDALDTALITPDYLNAVSKAFAATCGRPSAVSAENLYLNVTSSVPRVRYEGGEVAVHAIVSRNITADLTYGLVYARAFGNEGALFGGGSTVVSGLQLPNVPIATANLGVAAKIGRSESRFLANLRHVAGNNANNLPAYTTVDVGVDKPLSHGAHLTVSALNVTGAYVGVFATSANAVALPTGHGSFATVSTPLPPRSLNVSLRLPFGLGAGLEDVPDLGAGPGTYGYRLYPYNRATPSDAFAIDRRSGRCGPEAVSGATHELAVIDDYTRRVEARRSAGGAYPAAFPTEEHDGLVLTYRRTAYAYAVLVSADVRLSFSQRLPILRPLAGCARFYSGTLPETRERDLYIPAYDEQQEIMPLAEFSPLIGFYVPPSRLENVRLFPAYAEPPRSPPEDPFAIASSPDCAPSARPGAQAFIALVRPYITALYAGAEQKPPAGFTITDHREGKRWLSISSADMDVKLLAGCIRISALDAPTLEKMGLGGTPSPTLNFSPALGFYSRF